MVLIPVAACFTIPFFSTSAKVPPPTSRGYTRDQFQPRVIAEETMKNTLVTFIRITTICFLLPLTLSFRASAQQTSPPPTQEQLNQQLMDRIQELETQVKQLKETPPAATNPAAAPEPPPPVVQAPRVNEVAPRLKLDFFGDLGYQVGHYYGPNNSFEIGSFDMFAIARLSRRASVLGELLFTPGDDNNISLDIERLLIKYRQSDYFEASIGRIHTDIGYYNTAFNRGDYFQTGIGRPAMFEFDDQGGFLPLQDLGIVLAGKIPSGKAGLNYVFEVTNGRAYGADAQPAQNRSDGNNSKAVNVNISAKPDWVPGLDVGFSVRHDYLTDVNNLRISETIPIVYVVYNSSKYEWLNEGMFVTHAQPFGRSFHTPGFYTQFSRKFGAYRPYFRYSYVNGNENDPIYGDETEMPEVGRINGPTLGLRYDFNDHAAFKVQYDREGADGEKSTNGASGQFAFTF
jgi:hypothetical protein